MDNLQFFFGFVIGTFWTWLMFVRPAMDKLADYQRAMNTPMTHAMPSPTNVPQQPQKREETEDPS
jgi:hypothetical protein